MKKFITLVAAAMMAVGAWAQEGDSYPKAIPLGGGWNAGFVGEADSFDYTVTKQWGAAEFALGVLAADYPSFILEFEEPLASNFQVNYLWKTSADAEGDPTPAYGRAVGDGETTKFELFFDEAHPYITGVSVQHTDEVEAALKIKKLTLKAKSGEDLKIAPAFTSWAGTDNTIVYKGTVSYNGQWQQLLLNNVAGEKNLEIKVELAAATENVQMCVDYDDKTSEWPQFEGTVAQFKTQKDKIISSIGIQRKVADPISVEVVGAWIMSISTGINDVKIADANSELVNVAGQRVGKNAKGLVIDRVSGKKYVR